MFGPVKDHDLSTNTHGSYNVWVLWLVSSLVDLALVIDLLLDGEFDSRRLSRSIATNFAILFVVVALIRSDGLR